MASQVLSPALEEALDAFTAKVLAQPEVFAAVDDIEDEDVLGAIDDTLVSLIEVCANNPPNVPHALYPEGLNPSNVSGEIEELIVEGLDPEQVWAQLELFNSSRSLFLDHATAMLKKHQDSVDFGSDDPGTSTMDVEDGSESGSEGDGELGDSDSEGELSTDGEESDVDMMSASTKAALLEGLVSDEDSNGDESDGARDQDNGEDSVEEFMKNRGKPLTLYDFQDEFFDINDMKEMVDEAEAADELVRSRKAAGEDIDSAGELDEDIGKFLYGDEELSDLSEGENARARDELFDGPKAPKNPVANTLTDDEESDEDFNDTTDGFAALRRLDERNAKAEAQETQGSRDLFGSDDESGQSEFARARAKAKDSLTQSIEELEEERLGSKHWSMVGEVKGAARPKDSLLSVVVDFNHAGKAAPVITQEFTDNLEELIKQRCKDDAFDDPVRILAANMQQRKTFDQVQINMEKSTMGLGDIYANDTTGTLDAEEDKVLNMKHREVERLMAQLDYQLASLSNFAFTPAPVIPEMELKSTKEKSITMEDSTPMAVSTASQLAPEEVYSKTHGDKKAEGELSQKERKAARAARKRARAAERKRLSAEKIASYDEGALRGTRHTREATVESLRKMRNVEIHEGNKFAEKTNYTKSASFAKKMKDNEAREARRRSGEEARKGSKRGATSSFKL